MNKIAIYTLYDALNFGAYLQAYALEKTIQKQGKHVYFAAIKNENDQLYNINSKKSILKKIGRLKNLKSGLYRRKQEKKFNECIEKFELIDKNNFKKEKIDGIIIGSDEIWNVTNIHFKHIEEFFGYDLPIDNIVSFAASCNTTNKKQLELYKENIDFNNFKYISVRDKNTYDLVKQYTSKKIYKVLDPTFLIDDYCSIMSKCPYNDFILVYGYKFTKAQIKDIKQLSRTMKIPLISIGLYQEWCDKNVVANPFDFLGYVKNAKYVITSTFHGSVFSIILEKNFASYVGNNAKIFDLLDKFKLLDRNATNGNLSQIINTNIDYKNVNKIKEELKTSTEKYLNMILKH